MTPLPFRGGLPPLRVRLPHGAHPPTTLDYLAALEPPEPWADRMAAGEVVDERGRLFGVFGNLAVSIQSEAYCTELFPTAYRATAAALRFIAQILTGAVGLLIQGAVLAPLVGFGEAVLILLCPVPLALIGVYFLPETAGKSLEDLTPIETAAPFS